MKRLGNKNTIRLSIIALLSVAIIVLVSLTIRTFINAKRPIPSLLKDNTPLNYITRIDDDIRKAERERQEAPLYEAIRLKEEGRRLYEITIRRQLIEDKEEEELRLKPIRDAIIENAMRIREEGRYKYMESLLTPTKPTLNAATIDVIRETKPEPIIIPVEKPIEDMRVEEKLPEVDEGVPEVKTPSVPSVPTVEIIEPVVEPTVEHEVVEPIVPVAPSAPVAEIIEPVVEPTVEHEVVEPIVPVAPSAPVAEIIEPVVEPTVIPEVVEPAVPVIPSAPIAEIIEPVVEPTVEPVIVEPIVPSTPSVPTAEIIEPVVEHIVEPEVIEPAVPSPPTVPSTEVIKPVKEPITELITESFTEPQEMRLTHYLIKITYENTRRVVNVTDRKTGDVYSGTLDVIDGVRTLKTENNNTLTLV